MLRLIRNTIQARPCINRIIGTRGYSAATPEGSTDGEKKLTELLRQKFPSAEHIKVEDISGGCGAMYDIQVVSSDFEKKRKVDQHRLVNEALKDEMASLHGLTIKTAEPSKT